MCALAGLPARAAARLRALEAGAPALAAGATGRLQLDDLMEPGSFVYLLPLIVPSLFPVDQAERALTLREARFMYDGAAAAVAGTLAGILRRIDWRALLPGPGRAPRPRCTTEPEAALAMLGQVTCLFQTLSALLTSPFRVREGPDRATATREAARRFAGHDVFGLAADLAAAWADLAASSTAELKGSLACDVVANCAPWVQRVVAAWSLEAESEAWGAAGTPRVAVLGQYHAGTCALLLRLVTTPELLPPRLLAWNGVCWGQRRYLLGESTRHLRWAARLYEELDAAGAAPHAAYARAFGEAAASSLLVHVMEQGLVGGCGGPGGEACNWQTNLDSVHCGLMAYATLNEDAASPLEPEAEARLQALLAERVAPLLTRCLQAWKAGPPEGQRRVPDAVACLASNALGNLLSDSPLCKRMPGKEHIRGVRVLYTLLQWTAERIAELDVHGASARVDASLGGSNMLQRTYEGLVWFNSPWSLLADAPLAQEDAERRERVLPVALAAMEAALRRATDALGASPHRDSCDFAVQAAQHAKRLLQSVGACSAVPPAAKALLSTLATLLAADDTSRPSSGLHMMLSGMLVRVMPDLLQVDAGLSASGRALPAELLPYAAVQLLPALLLCGLAAAEITGPGGNSQAPDFIASVLTVCGRLAAATSSEECRAVVPACAGLVPFVVDALRGLAEHCGPFAMDSTPAPSSGSAYAAWKTQAQRRVMPALASLGSLMDESSALAAALARAGTLGAAARLAQRYVDAHEPPDREAVAALVTGALRDVLRGIAAHVPEAAPLVHSTFPPEPPGGAAYQRAVTATAAAVLRFEAEVKPGIAAEAHPEPSLEDLRLATPALRPVGCWWSGCGELAGASEAGLPLQLCSGCNIARFCSPACHRAAWREGHRGGCRRLQALA